MQMGEIMLKMLKTPIDIISSIRNGGDMQTLQVLVNYYGADMFCKHFKTKNNNCKKIVKIWKFFVSHALIISIILNSFNIILQIKDAYETKNVIPILSKTCGITNFNKNSEIERHINSIGNEDKLFPMELNIFGVKILNFGSLGHRNNLDDFHVDVGVGVHEK